MIATFATSAGASGKTLATEQRTSSMCVGSGSQTDTDAGSGTEGWVGCEAAFTGPVGSLIVSRQWRFFACQL